jgi:stage II sporulation protein D
VRLEADMLTLGEGRTARSYPERLLVSAGTGRLSLVNECSLEAYTQGVLCGECPASFHPEAIKAMAIAVRSYSYRKAFIARAELCDTTHCQVYRGLGSVRSSIRDAVRATAGIVALYDGEVIDAVYCSDCGGYTEGNEDAWRGAKPLPYLRPVEDAPEPHGTPYCAVNRSHTWSLTLPLSRLSALAGKMAPGWKLNLQDFTASGRVRLLGVGPAPKLDEMPKAGPLKDQDPDDPGEAPAPETIKPAVKTDRSPLSALRTFTGEQWRQLLGLSNIKSLLFTVRTTEKGIEIDGRGWGHGVGLCQFGAHGMALHGATCEEILKHYYTGVTLGPAPPPAAASAPAPRRRLSHRPGTGRRHS